MGYGHTGHVGTISVRTLRAKTTATIMIVKRVGLVMVVILMAVMLMLPASSIHHSMTINQSGTTTPKLESRAGADVGTSASMCDVAHRVSLSFLQR
jgi:hypothetical protein